MAPEVAVEIEAESEFSSVREKYMGGLSSVDTEENAGDTGLNCDDSIREVRCWSSMNELSLSVEFFSVGSWPVGLGLSAE